MFYVRKNGGKDRCGNGGFNGSKCGLLTIYDMLKAVDRSMEITDIRLLYKMVAKVESTKYDYL